MTLGNPYEGTRSLPPRAAQFHFIHRIFVALVPSVLRAFLDRLLFRVAPDVPFSLGQLFADVTIVRVFWTSFVITLAFCFGGTLLGTAISGTLRGTTPGIRYFIQDWQNIVNYTVICPLYIGCAMSLIVLSLRMRGLDILRTATIDISNLSPRYGMLPVPGIAATVLFIASLGTVNFAVEILNPRIYPVIYWFLQPNSTNQVRILGPLGVYYVIMNFVLLAICVLALCFFIDFVIVGREIGRALKNADVSRTVSFPDLRQRLELFTYAYLCSKALVMLIIANMYTWAGMELKGSLNMAILISVLTVAGLIIIPFPRYYVQLKWYEFNIRKAQAGLGTLPNYEDLRPDWVQGMAKALDYLIVLGFIKASWSWLLDVFH